jgi:hypothetical protein
MATQESTLKGGNFSTSSSIVIGNGISTYSGSCTVGRACSTAAGNGSQDNAHISNPSSTGERLGREPSTLVQCAQPMGGSLDG